MTQPSDQTEHKQIYISITGLWIKKPWHIFNFIYFAVPSKIQSEKAPGNLYSEVRNIGKVKHTLSFWTSKKDMLAFAYSGHHKKAIAAFSHSFEGTTYGYLAEKKPNWDEALAMLKAHGKPYSVKKNYE